MGWYTTVIVSVSGLEEEDNETKTVKLLPKLRELGRFFPLPDVDDYIFAGTTKYLDIDGFLRNLATIDWQYPDEVQVWYRCEDEYEFRLVHGVESSDPRISLRDDLLFQIYDLLTDLLQSLSDTAGIDMSDIADWIERYKQLRGEQ